MDSDSISDGTDEEILEIARGIYGSVAAMCTLCVLGV